MKKEAVFDDTERRKWKIITSANRITDFVFMVAISLRVGDLIRVVEPPPLPPLGATPDTIAAKSITCSPFFSQQLFSYCITVGVAARNYFQLQLQPRSLHGIIFQFRLQPNNNVRFVAYFVGLCAIGQCTSPLLRCVAAAVALRGGGGDCVCWVRAMCCV